MSSNKLAEQALNWSDTESVNEVFKEIYDQFDTRVLTEFQYEQVFNRIQARYPEEVRQHFLNRADARKPRSLGEFAVDIYNGHKNQEAIIEYFLSNLAQKYFPTNGVPVTAKNTGVASAGYLILNDGNGEARGMPDYLLLPADKPLEVKSNPCWWKATYKKDDINGYSRKKAYVLTCCSCGKRIYADGKNIVCVFVISPEVLDRMIAQSVVTKRWEVGHKEAIQFWFNMDDIMRLNKVRADGDKLSGRALRLEDFVEIFWVDESKKIRPLEE